MGTWYSLHPVIVQVSSEIVDMYNLTIPHGGKGDGDARHEGGGRGGQTRVRGCRDRMTAGGRT